MDTKFTKFTKLQRKTSFRDIYELMKHGEYLFCKCVVGLRIKQELHRKGYVYQFIRDGKEEMHFIFTRLRFNPLLWTEKKLDEHLQELFAFVPKDIIIKDHSELERFNEGLQVKHLSYPLKRRLEQGEEGVFYITPSGKEVSFLKDKGKPMYKWTTLTLFHPLCPLFALV